MAAPVTVPRLGWTMDEGTFAGWLKQDGDAVRPGDALFTLESEKSTEPIEAIDAGTLRLLPDGPRTGDVVRVGQVLAYLTAEGEDLASGAASARRLSSVPGESTGGLTPRRSPGETRSGRIAASPRARRAARELGIDWATVPGTGRGGRVRERDVRAAATATGGRLIPHTPARKVIAARMVAGVTVAAPVTLTTKADATHLVALRGRFPGEARPTYNDLILKAVADALRHHSLLRAQWRDDGLFVPDGVHLAVAVDTETGLLAPVVRDADRLTVEEIAVQTREMLALARAGRLPAERMRGATFTVSNLGMFGVDAFTPILALPQCAVLGVGRIVREPAVVGDRVEPRDRLTLSLTFDHRVVDGAPAARFLDAVRRHIEQAGEATP